MSSDWPFKGKPSTNAHIKAILVIVWWIAWALLPAITILATLGVFLFLIGRASWRAIRKEW